MKRYALLGLIVLLCSVSALAQNVVETYAQGDYLNISVQVQQDNTGEPSAYKHLEYEITNQQGNIIETNQGRRLVLLDGYGDYSKRIGDPSSGVGILIKREWFASTEGDRGNSFSQWRSIGAAAQTTSTDITLINPGSVTLTRSGVPASDPKQYVVEADNTGGTLTYVVSQGGEFRRGEGFIGTTPIQGCAGNLAPSQSISCTDGELVLAFDFTSQLPSSGEQTQVHMTLNSDIGTDPCSDQNKVRPQNFQVTFRVYDSDEFGQPLDQISIDPLTGQEAILTKRFQATCARATDDAFEELIQEAQGEVPESQILAQLQAILSQLIRTEQGMRDELDSIIETAPVDSSQANTRAATIQTMLQELLAQERQAAAQLQPVHAAALQSTSSNAAAIRNQLGLLLDALNQPPVQPIPSQQSTALVNIHDTVNTEQDVIAIEQDKITDPTNTGDWRVIDESVQRVINNIDRILEAKQQLRTTAGGGAITGISVTCPDGQREQGNYYTCATTSPHPAYSEDTQQRDCPQTYQTCYQLPSQNICEGEDFEYKFRCVAENQIPGGWEVYDIGADGNPQTAQSAKLCLDPTTPVCVSQSVYGAPISPEEQLVLIKNEVLDFITELGPREQYYREQSTITDSQASNYLISQQNEEIQQRLDSFATFLEQTSADILALTNRPLIGESRLPQEDVTDYTTAITGLANNIRTYYKSAFEIATSPAEIRERFLELAEQIHSYRNEYTSPVNEIRDELGEKDPCPEGFRGIHQYTCYENTCPSHLIAGDDYDTRNWNDVSDYYSCDPGRVCCKRFADPMVLYKEWDDLTNRYPSGYTPADIGNMYTEWNPIEETNQPLRLRVLLPYQEQDDITNPVYQYFGQSGTRNEEPIESLHYQEYPDQKLAHADLSLSLERTQRYSFEYDIDGHPFRSSVIFNVPCPTDAGPHRIASHACLSSSNSTYGHPDDRYTCPPRPDVVRKTCYSELDERYVTLSNGDKRGCYKGRGNNVFCQCSTTSGQTVSGVRAGQLPQGKTPLEHCRDHCADDPDNRGYRGIAC